MIKKNIILSIAVIALVFMLSSCGSGVGSVSQMNYEGVTSVSNSVGFSPFDTASDKSYDSDSIAAENSNENGETVMADNSDTELTNDKIVYHADVYIDTADFADSDVKLSAMIGRYGVVIESRDYDTYDNRKHEYARLRVPSENLQKMLDGVAEIGRVTSSKIYSDNITQQYIDVESRLTAKRKRVDRINDFIAKTEDYGELKSLYNDLETAEYELENLESQLKNMRMDVAYSYLNVTLNDTHLYTEGGREIGEDSWFARRWYDIWDSLRIFRAICNYILVACIYLIPYVLVGVIAFLLVKRKLKKKKTRIGTKQSETGNGNGSGDTK